MKAKPTQYGKTFNLYDLFILINNNMYIFVATRNITNVCMIVFNSF